MSNISYKPVSLLPKVYPLEEHALDIATGVRIGGVSLELQRIKTLANPKECPVEFLPILAYSFGSDFYWEFKDLDEAQQREMIANSLILHRKKGTLWAIEKVLSILGFETEITEWWEEKEDPFEINPTKPYTFVIVVDIARFIQNSKRVFSEYEQRRVLKYLYIYKNVRSHFDFYVKASFENRIAILNNIKVSDATKRDAVSEQYQKDTHADIGLGSMFVVDDVNYLKGEIKRPTVSSLTASVVATFKIKEVNRWQ